MVEEECVACDEVALNWRGLISRFSMARALLPARSEPERSQSRWTARRVLGVLFLDLYCAFHSASHVDR
jgi:hypothetical protein